MTDNNASTSGPPLDDHLRSGINVLWQAFCYAKDAKADLWDFAIEIEALYELELTVSDLRWLVTKGYAEHGQETSQYGDAHRSFRINSGLNFTNTTCFVLSASGQSFAAKLVEDQTSAS